MRKEYDFSDSVRNPYAKHLKKQVTLRLNIDAISYFKAVKEVWLECYTELLHRGKTIASLESKILSQDALIAKAHGHFSIFRPSSSP